MIFFFFNDTATTEIYTLSLHDALPILFALFALGFAALASVIGSLYMLHRFWALTVDRLADSQHPIMVATRQGIRSEEHTSELQSHLNLVCRLLLEKKNDRQNYITKTKS